MPEREYDRGHGNYRSPKAKVADRKPGGLRYPLIAHPDKSGYAPPAMSRRGRLLSSPSVSRGSASWKPLTWQPHKPPTATTRASERSSPASRGARSQTLNGQGLRQPAYTAVAIIKR